MFDALIKRKYILSVDTYYHGSDDELEVGTILKPQGRTDGIPNFLILEKYRPSHMLSQKDVVFLVKDDDDIDNVGGGTDFLFTVTPLGKVEKHNLGWSTELSGLESGNPEKEEEFANNYWNAVPHPNGVWEYLTTSAKIIKVEEY